MLKKFNLEYSRIINESLNSRNDILDEEDYTISTKTKKINGLTISVDKWKNNLKEYYFDYINKLHIKEDEKEKAINEIYNILSSTLIKCYEEETPINVTLLHQSGRSNESNKYPGGSADYVDGIAINEINDENDLFYYIDPYKDYKEHYDRWEAEKHNGNKRISNIIDIYVSGKNNDNAVISEFLNNLSESTIEDNRVERFNSAKKNVKEFKPSFSMSNELVDLIKKLENDAAFEPKTYMLNNSDGRNNWNIYFSKNEKDKIINVLKDFSEETLNEYKKYLNELLPGKHQYDQYAEGNAYWKDQSLTDNLNHAENTLKQYINNFIDEAIKK